MLELEGRDSKILGRSAVGATVGEVLTNSPLQLDGNVDAQVPAASALAWLKVYLALVLRIVS